MMARALFRSRRWSGRCTGRALPVGLIVAMTLVLGEGPALAAKPWTPPAQVEQKVTGTNLPPTPPRTDPDRAVSVTGPRAVTWPPAQTAVVDLAAAPARGAQPGAGAGVTAVGPVRAGGSPVWVGAAAPRSERQETAAPPGRIRVEVLDREQNRRSTIDGPLIRVGTEGARRAAATADRVTVDVDYRHAGGGAWASRLRLATVPACALSTPAVAGCAPTPLRSTNDVRTQRVSGTVTLPSGGTALLTVVAAADGPSGNFGATSLAASATWSAGGSSGDFNWAYPIRVPPALGGPTPQVSLAYSAGSVDGRTAATNNQPSWAGLGFEFWPGQIECKYKPCAMTRTGTACWVRVSVPEGFMWVSLSSVRLLRISTFCRVRAWVECSPEEHLSPDNYGKELCQARRPPPMNHGTRRANRRSGPAAYARP
jgi:hypothetical protein